MGQGNSTCDEVSGLANSHEHKPGPPELTSQIQHLILLVLPILFIPALRRMNCSIRRGRGFSGRPRGSLESSLDSFMGKALDVEGKGNDDVTGETDDDADERGPAGLAAVV